MLHNILLRDLLYIFGLFHFIFITAKGQSIFQNYDCNWISSKSTSKDVTIKNGCAKNKFVVDLDLSKDYGKVNYFLCCAIQVKKTGEPLLWKSDLSGSGHITESKEIGYEHCYERLRASWSDFIYWEFYCDYDSKYNRGYAFDTDNEPYFVVGWSVRGEASSYITFTARKAIYAGEEVGFNQKLEKSIKSSEINRQIYESDLYKGRRGFIITNLEVSGPASTNFLANYFEPKITCPPNSELLGTSCICDEGYIAKNYTEYCYNGACQRYCEGCPAGYLCPQMQKMKMCKAGTYCINNVQTDCPEGYTSKEGSGACQRLKEGCMMPTIAGDLTSGCRRCFDGVQISSNEGAKYCYCLPGSFFDKDQKYCVMCEGDEYVKEIGNNKLECAKIVMNPYNTSETSGGGQTKSSSQKFGITIYGAAKQENFTIAVVITEGFSTSNEPDSVQLDYQTTLDGKPITLGKELSLDATKIITGEESIFEVKGLEPGKIITFWVRSFYNNKQQKQSSVWIHYTRTSFCGCDGTKFDYPSGSDHPEKDVFFDRTYMKVCPRWKDNSYCDEKYTLSKWVVGSQTQVTSDENGKEVSNEFQSFLTYQSDTADCLFVNNREACDDIISNEYDVGTEIVYRINIERYESISVDLYDYENAPPEYEVKFKIPWIGTLIVEGIAGDNRTTPSPITNYYVTVYVGEKNYDTFFVNSTAGTLNVQITTNNYETFNDVFLIPFKSTPHNTTHNFTHDLVCKTNSEEEDCSSYKVSIKHMSSAKITILDKSIAFARGRLSYKDSEKYTGKTGNPCTVPNKTVCALNKNTKKKNCISTDNFGYYEHQLFYDQEYEIYVQEDVDVDNNTEYNYRVDSSKVKNLGPHLQNNYDNWFVYMSDTFEQLNFHNVLTRSLQVEYYGGECKLPLDGGRFEISSPLCPEFEYYTQISRNGMSTKEILPPLLYVVKYMENEDFYADPAFKSDINVFFTGANDRKEVDLRKNDNTTYFRYEGPVITKVTVFGDYVTCRQQGPLLASGDIYPFTFVSYQTYPNGGKCKKFPNTTKVRVYDQIGDNGGLCANEEGGNKGCFPEFDHRKGRTTVNVRAGKPNYFPPYTKTIIYDLIMETKAYPSFVYQVVVEGSFTNSEELLSIGFPKWTPLLVIHQPPGDSSFATFEMDNTFNSGLTVALDTIFEKGAGVLTDSSLEEETSSCVNSGVTAGPGVMTYAISECVEKSSALVDKSKNTLSKIDNSGTKTDTSAEQSNVQFFSTSPAKGLRGGDGDLFIVPNIRILVYEKMFLEVILSDYEEGSDTVVCIPQVSRKLTQNLEKSENQEAISMLTAWDIKNSELPQIEKTMNSLLEEEEVDEDLIGTLQDAYAGWARLLELNENNKRMALLTPKPLQIKKYAAADGSNNLCYRRPSYSRLAKIGMTSKDCEGNHLGIYKAYLEEFCMEEDADCDKQDDVIFDYCGDPEECVKSPSTSGIKEAANSDLEQINRITFTGGGSAIQFKFEDSNTHSSVEDSREVKSYGGDTNIGIFSKVITANFRIGFNNYKKTRSSTANRRKTTFTLKDSNIGDNFDVAVYEDPMFGTPVFVVKAGESKCPHEENTVAREQIDIRLAEGHPNRIENVNTDEVVYLPIEIMNENQMEEVFPTVSLVSSSNPNNLRVNLNGIPLASNGGQVIQVAAGELVPLTLEITRGIGYTFEEVQIRVSSTCELELSQNGELPTGPIFKSLNFSVYYLEPCSPISWWGSIDTYKDFLITQESAKETPKNGVEVAIKNLFSKPFIEQDRLATIELQYRKVGTRDWKPPKIHSLDGSDDTPPYFFNRELNINVEDNQHVAILKWDTTPLNSGHYEIRVLASCKDSGGGKLVDNTYLSVVSGVVDRLPPGRLGIPEPADKNFVLGKSQLAIEFNEDIDCSRPYKHKIELYLPSINRTYYFDSLSQEGNSNPGLVSYCEDNKIQFYVNAAIDYEAFMGNTAIVKVCNVVDKVGNAIENCEEWDFVFARIDIGIVGSQLKVSNLPSADVAQERLLKEFKIASDCGQEMFKIDSIEKVETTDSEKVSLVKFHVQEENGVDPLKCLKKLSSTLYQERKNKEQYEVLENNEIEQSASGRWEEERELEEKINVNTPNTVQKEGNAEVSGEEVSDEGNLEESKIENQAGNQEEYEDQKISQHSEQDILYSEANVANKEEAEDARINYDDYEDFYEDFEEDFYKYEERRSVRGDKPKRRLFIPKRLGNRNRISRIEKQQKTQNMDVESKQESADSLLRIENNYSDYLKEVELFSHRLGEQRASDTFLQYDDFLRKVKERGYELINIYFSESGEVQLEKLKALKDYLIRVFPDSERVRVQFDEKQELKKLEELLYSVRDTRNENIEAKKKDLFDKYLSTKGESYLKILRELKKKSSLLKNKFGKVETSLFILQNAQLDSDLEVMSVTTKEERKIEEVKSKPVNNKILFIFIQSAAAASLVLLFATLAIIIFTKTKVAAWEKKKKKSHARF